MPEPERDRWWRRALRRTAMVWMICGVTFAAVALAELGARAWLWWRPPHDPFSDSRPLRVRAEDDAPWTRQYQAELESSNDTMGARDLVGWRHHPSQGAFINVGDDGNRRTWNRATAGPDELELWLFGGSTVWGFGQRDDQTIASQLSRLLADAGLAVRVRNFGEWAYTSTQEVALLLLALQTEARRPALVVFVDGLNDVCAALASPGEPPSIWLRHLVLPRERSPWASLLRRSGLHRLLARPRESPALRPERFAAVAPWLAAVYAVNLRAAEALGRQFGFRALGYWQPTITRKPRLSPLEEALRFVEPMMHGPERALFDQTANAVRAALGADPAFHDIQDLFAGDSETVYSDNMHYTERAAGRIAARLAADVIPLARQLTDSSAKRTQ